MDLFITFMQNEKIILLALFSVNIYVDFILQIKIFCYTPAGPFKRFPTHVWQNAHVNIVRRAMVCDFPFSKFYSFIKGIMHIYIVFLKNLRQTF